MSTTREPILQPVPILSLRPTQMTVGMREVKEKRKRWRAHASDRKRAELLGTHMIPVVLGPDGKHYVVDHHHLARALHEEGVQDILVSVVADLTVVDKAAFWGVLDHLRLAYPYDAKGERRCFKEIPRSIVDLQDDPYRSVAGAVRRAGGFAKDTTPFSEFLWADLFRRRLSRREIKADFARAVDTALAIARSAQASYLPGWCGPASEP